MASNYTWRMYDESGKLQTNPPDNLADIALLPEKDRLYAMLCYRVGVEERTLRDVVSGVSKPETLAASWPTFGHHEAMRNASKEFADFGNMSFEDYKNKPLDDKHKDLLKDCDEQFVQSKSRKGLLNPVSHAIDHSDAMEQFYIINGTDMEGAGDHISRIIASPLAWIEYKDTLTEDLEKKHRAHVQARADAETRLHDITRNMANANIPCGLTMYREAFAPMAKATEGDIAGDIERVRDLMTQISKYDKPTDIADIVGYISTGIGAAGMVASVGASGVNFIGAELANAVKDGTFDRVTQYIAAAGSLASDLSANIDGIKTFVQGVDEYRKSELPPAEKADAFLKNTKTAVSTLSSGFSAVEHVGKALSLANHAAAAAATSAGQIGGAVTGVLMGGIQIGMGMRKLEDASNRKEAAQDMTVQSNAQLNASVTNTEGLAPGVLAAVNKLNTRYGEMQANQAVQAEDRAVVDGNAAVADIAIGTMKAVGAAAGAVPGGGVVSTAVGILASATNFVKDKLVANVVNQIKQDRVTAESGLDFYMASLMHADPNLTRYDAKDICLQEMGLDSGKRAEALCRTAYEDAKVLEALMAQDSDTVGHEAGTEICAAFGINKKLFADLEAAKKRGDQKGIDEARETAYAAAMESMYGTELAPSKIANHLAQMGHHSTIRLVSKENERAVHARKFLDNDNAKGESAGKGQLYYNFTEEELRTAEAELKARDLAQLKRYEDLKAAKEAAKDAVAEITEITAAGTKLRDDIKAGLQRRLDDAVLAGADDKVIKDIREQMADNERLYKEEYADPMDAALAKVEEAVAAYGIKEENAHKSLQTQTDALIESRKKTVDGLVQTGRIKREAEEKAAFDSYPERVAEHNKKAWETRDKIREANQAEANAQKVEDKRRYRAEAAKLAAGLEASRVSLNETRDLAEAYRKRENITETNKDRADKYNLHARQKEAFDRTQTRKAEYVANVKRLKAEKHALRFLSKNPDATLSAEEQQRLKVKYNARRKELLEERERLNEDYLEEKRLSREYEARELGGPSADERRKMKKPKGPATAQAQTADEGGHTQENAQENKNRRKDKPLTDGEKALAESIALEAKEGIAKEDALAAAKAEDDRQRDLEKAAYVNWNDTKATYDAAKARGDEKLEKDTKDFWDEYTNKSKTVDELKALEKSIAAAKAEGKARDDGFEAQKDLKEKYEERFIREERETREAAEKAAYDGWPARRGQRNARLEEINQEISAANGMRTAAAEKGKPALGQEFIIADLGKEREEIIAEMDDMGKMKDAYERRVGIDPETDANAKDRARLEAAAEARYKAEAPKRKAAAEKEQKDAYNKWLDNRDGMVNRRNELEAQIAAGTGGADALENELESLQERLGRQYALKESYELRKNKTETDAQRSKREWDESLVLRAEKIGDMSVIENREQLAKNLSDDTRVAHDTLAENTAHLNNLTQRRADDALMSPSEKITAKITQKCAGDALERQKQLAGEHEKQQAALKDVAAQKEKEEKELKAAQEVIDKNKEAVGDPDFEARDEENAERARREVEAASREVERQHELSRDKKLSAKQRDDAILAKAAAQQAVLDKHAAYAQAVLDTRKHVEQRKEYVAAVETVDRILNNKQPEKPEQTEKTQQQKEETKEETKEKAKEKVNINILTREEEAGKASKPNAAHTNAPARQRSEIRTAAMGIGK